MEGVPETSRGGFFMEGIRVQNLTKDYGSVLALDDVSLEILPGELFFLLGSSGCGKSTLLRSIAGLEEPTSGSIHFGERDVTHLATHKREAAMVFQSYALWPHMTVAQNVAFGLQERKLPREEIDAKVAEALQLVHLGALGGRQIDQLSGGQQQRVALARALVVRPRCLLLDEPLSNLDAKLRIEMRSEIRRIVKEGELTAVYVTHDQEEALAMADRIAVMDAGKIVQVGSPEEVYRRPESEMVASFIGETNFLRGTARNRDGQLTVETDLGPFHVGSARSDISEGSSVVLSIRPECFAADVVDNHVTGEVVESVYLGREARFQLRAEAGHLLEISEVNPDPGDLVPGLERTLGVHPQDVVVLNKGA